MLIILLFISGHLKAQGINTLKVDSQLSISLLLGEISGMSFHEDDVYALNDGGNGSNKDWEELSIYNGNLYIGDLGNNSGTRRDLAIHRIKIDSLSESKPPVFTTWIEYLMQKEYKRAIHNHEWDCEAMVVTKDGIYCFSKNWKDLTTRLYRVEEGKNNILSPIDSFNAGFLVTGAYYHSQGKSLYLCGYYKNDTYLLHFRNTDNVRFSEDYTKYIIPELRFTQVESIFVRGNYVYLASERTLKKQAIYRILVSGLK